MAYLSPVILKGKVKANGKHRVRIALSHNGATRYLMTNIFLDSDKEFKNGRIVKRPDANYLNTQLSKIIQRYQKAMDEIDYINVLSCSQLVSELKAKVSSQEKTIKDVFEDIISFSDRKETTITTMKRSFNTLASVVSPETPVAAITANMVMAVESALRKKKLNQCTIWSYMSLFTRIISFAKKCGYVNYTRDPLLGYKSLKPTVRDCWLTIDEIKLIRDAKGLTDTRERFRDIFMLSYYLGGVNLVDLASMKFNLTSGKLKYKRQKTERISKINEYVQFDIPAEAIAIIRKLDLDENDTILSKFYGNRFARAQETCAYTIPKIGEFLGLSKRLIYYSARKSFAQHSYQLGISQAVIDFILGHKINASGNSIFAYIYVTPEMATNALRKVLDNLK